MIAGSPETTNPGFLRGLSVQLARINVGASLLAIAVFQTTEMLSVPASSPAGWLPQKSQSPQGSAIS
jgi:hypothetical protein